MVKPGRRNLAGGEEDGDEALGCGRRRRDDCSPDAWMVSPDAALHGGENGGVGFVSIVLEVAWRMRSRWFGRRQAPVNSSCSMYSSEGRGWGLGRCARSWEKEWTQTRAVGSAHLVGIDKNTAAAMADSGERFLRPRGARFRVFGGKGEAAGLGIYRGEQNEQTPRI